MDIDKENCLLDNRDINFALWSISLTMYKQVDVREFQPEIDREREIIEAYYLHICY